MPPDQAALALAGASGIVRTYCRWEISREEAATFKVDGSGVRVLSLPTLHITDVTSVEVDGTPLTVNTDVFWATRGQLYRAEDWPRWSTVEVVADSGYVDTPDVIKIVTLSLAARLVANPSALKSAAVGAVQRTFADTRLNSLELALLDAFRLP